MHHAELLTEFIRQHPRLTVLTGAGISTDSGIPAYRDEAGVWQHKPPVQHKVFMQDHYARQRYWARSLIGWPMIDKAQPSAAHRALTTLENMGHVQQIITQNVDGLHQKAGSQQVLDLHGRADEVACMNCGQRYSRNQVHQRSAEENPGFCGGAADVRPDGDADLEREDFANFQVPDCHQCGGILKPDVVFFGDNVPKEKVFSSLDIMKKSDGLLTIGTSLMVYSGYRYCLRARDCQLPIAALTLGITRADHLLQLKLDAPISETLDTAVAYLQTS
ncbi:NAD-dependent protein deacetylase [Pontibacter sp. JAM-7]|uniref:NAD-dependent protein deacetylase n=1 Tax=Pontibacter sp. JAM-7 TaxID=3366581 RepID=UPI003AF6C4F9